MTTDVIDGITRLTADSGLMLKKGKTESRVVWLAPADSAKNWTECAPTPKSTERQPTYAELAEAYRIVTEGE